MYYLLVFLAFVYGGIGLWTTIQTLRMKANPAASVLAGAFWPLFWLTGQNEKNRRLGRGNGRYLP
jgi:hypothetical protein